MSKKSKHLTIEISLREGELLQRYCKQERRTQTDVVREFIRSLENQVEFSS